MAAGMQPIFGASLCGGPLKDVPPEDFAKPEGIVEDVLIDTKTGLLGP